MKIKIIFYLVFTSVFLQSFTAEMPQEKKEGANESSFDVSNFNRISYLEIIIFPEILDKLKEHFKDLGEIEISDEKYDKKFCITFKKEQDFASINSFLIGNSIVLKWSHGLIRSSINPQKTAQMQSPAKFLIRSI